MKQKYIIFFGFYFIFANSIFSQIVNEGTLQIKSSTIVYFGDEYTNKTTATHNNEGDLYLNSNFVNNGATTSISGTTFFKSSSNPIQTISGDTKTINLFNLEINNTLTGVSVIDNFGLIVTNAVKLTSGDLRLVGDAQLVQTHSGTNLNTSNTGKLLKDQQGIASTFGFNYWSSPVNTGGAFSLNGDLFDGTDAAKNSFIQKQVLFSSSLDGAPSILTASDVTTALTISTRWLYKYTRGGIDVYADWIKIDENSTLNPGEGYLMKGTNTTTLSQNYVFKGVPNNGDYSFPMVAGESSLLGNPYPCALDATAFLNDNDGVNTLYFWVDGGSPNHNLADYLGGYATRMTWGGVAASVQSNINGLGTASDVSAPTRYIAVGQGFFIEPDADVTVTFKNSQRDFKTESDEDSNFYKTSHLKSNGISTTNTLDSTIRIHYFNPENFRRELLLGFLPDSSADLNYNPSVDGLMSNPRADELFYIIENDLTKKYVMQAVGAYDNSYEFPLGLILSQEGVHTIVLDELVNFTDKVYIRDNVLNTFYDLTTENYIPNIPVGEYFDRFSLVFKTQEVLAVSEFVGSNLNVHYNENSILINNKNNLIISNIFIYNMLGQKIMQVNNNLLKQEEITIPFKFKQGLYMVLIETDQGRKTYKIVN